MRIGREGKKLAHSAPNGFARFAIPWRLLREILST
jgi:hypothetical protein